MRATLRFLGRALMLKPAFYGERFHRHCTVMRNCSQRTWETDAVTGRRYCKTSKGVEELKMYWYDKLDGADVFCAYAGYGERILTVLKKAGIEVKVEEFVDHGLGEPDIEALKGVEWRGRQREIMARLFAYRGGVIDCPTAYGKTFIAGRLAKAYPKSQIIITTPFKDVADGIFSELQAQMWGQVGYVGDGKKDVRHITVAISKSLHKCPLEANLVLVDESHALLTDKYIEKLNKFHRAKMFGFTASAGDRSDRADGLAEAIFGPLVVSVGYQEGVASGNVVQLEVRMHKVSNGPDLTWSDNKTYIDRHGLWQNGIRNKIIASSVRNLEKEFGDDEQILIMTDTIEHAYGLGQLLPEFTIVTGLPDARRIARLRGNGIMKPDQRVCSAKSRSYYRHMFEQNKLKRVISTKVWRQGVDFKDLRILIRADGAASSIDSCQIPGRLSRLGSDGLKENGILVDFMDDFTANLKGRAMKRLRDYKKRGWLVRWV